MSSLSAFHGKHQPFGGVAHIDEVHGKIKIQLKTSAEKMPEHRHRRGDVVVTRPDGHGGTANNHRISGCRRLRSEPIGEHFRARIRTRHVVRQQRIVCGSSHRRRGTEQNGLRRAVQNALYATFARRPNDDLGSTVIDGVKISFPRQPHPRQASQVIDLVDPVHRSVHEVAIKYRSPDILNLRQGAGRWLKIEDPDLPASRYQRGDQVLSDEPTAAGDQYTRHAAEITMQHLADAPE